ncbi:epoxyqueuosine reductase [Thermus composti]|uniref:tRNA epoxyqueuosine(34) reductase QueG n=1 Tax=Thermus composti TaxID=532059 RepID=A0ABV6Q1R2_9DEIN|nr:tRNA epoxyqueuosine(34) reductase QueG [Thermus composti]GGN01347.1 epoxyqueuosine reductase [Thermus composti]
MVKDLLEERARGLGLLVAWAPLEIPEASRRRFLEWLEAGHHGEMAYLKRQAEARLHPQSLFPWAQSALLLFAPYAYPDPGRPQGGLRVGRVARYAWVRDYHLLLGEELRRLEVLAQGLGVRAKGYVDHGPLPERTLAALSGAGWIGKSGYFLSQAFGVHAFIGVLLTDLEVEAPPPHPNRCGRCARCLPACPTHALLGDGTLDARRCISYLTIEHKGFIPPSLWPGIGDWLFGCDLCGEACPWERFGKVWKGFRPEPELAHPDLLDFFRLSGRAFQRKYAGTAFLRAGRPRMARNALIVLFNLGLGEALFLEAAQDPSPLVRRTALHALFGAGRPVEAFLKDPDPLVRAEALALLGEAPRTVDLLQDGREPPGPEVKEEGA